jgi:hypothetical protein
MILMGFLVAPRVPFKLEVVTDGNGRSGREIGNDGFRTASGQAGCRDGDVGEASGDDTRGRLVLIASDMVDLIGPERIGRDRYKRVIWAEELRLFGGLSRRR